ncbi:hypothetical protein H4684_002929 [Desulfomicrobium macestii]|uniref:Uncharacterized protein n=1 Tax=Desulfomicrobium macestii TaxID=90731 RepID=A0ABR9H6C7_9BACT|nr:hypothetical protein [Desulfomicrobium macestii]MBE1426264.1 hypothetical protein [Desulfomicrobium macestii]
MTARKTLPVDLIDPLLADDKKPEDLFGEEGRDLPGNFGPLNS